MSLGIVVFGCELFCAGAVIGWGRAGWASESCTGLNRLRRINAITSLRLGHKGLGR